MDEDVSHNSVWAPGFIGDNKWEQYYRVCKIAYLQMTLFMNFYSKRDSMISVGWKDISEFLLMSNFFIIISKILSYL